MGSMFRKNSLIATIACRSSSSLATKKGVADFLSKPLDDDDLLRAVRAALESESTARAAFEEEQAIRRRLQSLTPSE